MAATARIARITQRAHEADPERLANVLLEWRVALARLRVPTGWPAAAGGPPAAASCAGCGGRGWWRQRDWWVCASCTPPGDPAIEVVS